MDTIACAEDVIGITPFMLASRAGVIPAVNTSADLSLGILNGETSFCVSNMNDENDDCGHETQKPGSPKKVKRFAVKRARDIFPCDAGELRTSCDDTRKEYHRDAVADAVFVNTFAEPHCKACAGSVAGDDDEAGEEACAW